MRSTSPSPGLLGHSHLPVVIRTGNIAPAKEVSPPDPKDLVTPTLKAEVYTTGRGGSGNMVPNESPDTARAAQDVDVPPPVQRGSADDRPVTMTGRGKRYSHSESHCLNDFADDVSCYLHLQVVPETQTTRAAARRVRNLTSKLVCRSRRRPSKQVLLSHNLPVSDGAFVPMFSICVEYLLYLVSVRRIQGLLGYIFLHYAHAIQYSFELFLLEIPTRVIMADVQVYG